MSNYSACLDLKESVQKTPHNFKFSSKWAVCTKRDVGIIWTMLSLFIGYFSWSMELLLGKSDVSACGLKELVIINW